MAGTNGIAGLAFDHAVLAVPDLESAGAVFDRLGLRPTPAAIGLGGASVARRIHIGETYLELIAVHDASAASAAPLARPLVDTIADGRTNCAVGLSVEDLAPVRAALAASGVAFIEARVDASACDVIHPIDQALFGCPVFVVQYDEDRPRRLERLAAEGLLTQDLPLQAFDHVAVIVHDDGPERAWADLLGVAVTRTVDGDGWRARQMQMQGGTVEFILSTSPDGPMARRRLGLSRLAAYEVDDLEGVVEDIRRRGFTLPDAGPGFSGGSRNSTLTIPELAGFRLQLVERGR